MDKTQQIQAYRLSVHPLELVDGVELDQRGIVEHAFRRQLHLRDHALRQGEQGLKLLAPLDFPEQLPVGEVLGLALDDGDLVQALVVGEQKVHRLRLLSAHQSLERPSQALALEN